MPTVSRREFFAVSAAAGAAAPAIRVGVIGTGGRGRYLMKELQKIGGVEFPAVCDIYDVRRAEAAQLAGGAEQYSDHKQVLARTDVDAVIVATPDHWHAPIAVDALNAGKDVYVEKPMVHTPKDGQALVRAARRNNRIVQVGTQGRALPQFVEAKQRYLDSGTIGKVGLVRTWYLSNSGYVQTPPPGMEQKPEGLDWNRWLGPGPKIAWNPDVYFSPYKWLHYDGGMIMGIGIHVIDSAHHWLNLTKPKAAVAMGDTVFYKDGRDTPDVITFALQYPNNLTVTFSAECLTAPGVRTSAGVEVRGTGGVVTADRYLLEPAYRFTPNSRFTKEPACDGSGTGASASNLLRNWLECIRTREKPVASEVEGYYSSMACFLAAQAFKTQTRVEWKPEWDLPPA